MKRDDTSEQEEYLRTPLPKRENKEMFGIIDQMMSQGGVRGRKG